VVIETLGILQKELLPSAGLNDGIYLGIYSLILLILQL
jgi:hypothetical protein